MATFVVPTTGADTLGLAMTHANAICAIVALFFFASSSLSGPSQSVLTFLGDGTLTGADGASSSRFRLRESGVPAAGDGWSALRVAAAAARVLGAGRQAVLFTVDGLR